MNHIVLAGFSWIASLLFEGIVHWAPFHLMLPRSCRIMSIWSIKSEAAWVNYPYSLISIWISRSLVYKNSFLSQIPWPSFLIQLPIQSAVLPPPSIIHLLPLLFVPWSPSPHRDVWPHRHPWPHYCADNYWSQQPNSNILWAQCKSLLSYVPPFSDSI